MYKYLTEDNNIMVSKSPVSFQNVKLPLRTQCVALNRGLRVLKGWRAHSPRLHMTSGLIMALFPAVNTT